MYITEDELKLLKETQNEAMSRSLYINALELEHARGIKVGIIVNEIVHGIRIIKSQNGGKVPITTPLLLRDGVLSKFFKGRIDSIDESKICYIQIDNGSYVIYLQPGEYMLTPDKEMASKFPSYKSAERFMRELWIDGVIVK